MDKLFHRLPFIRVYLDQIAVFSDDIERHVGRILHVLNVIRDDGLKLKISICLSAQADVDLLGHRANAHGLSVDLSKAKAIRKPPDPNTNTELWIFLGLAT